MEQSEDLVLMLARAYGLSELIDSGDHRLRRRVTEIRNGLAAGFPLEIVVHGDALRVDGEAVEDPHGFVGEMARDLTAAGVRAVRLSVEASPESLLSFFDGMRPGGGGGGPGAEEAKLAGGLDGITVTFEEVVGGWAGAAGEIETLFGDEDDEEASAEELEPPEPEDAGPVDGLTELVDELLDAPAPERDDLAETLAQRAAALREEGGTEEVAAAVERLVSAAHEGAGGSEALELARQMTSVGVAARLARRLGGVRDEDERTRLIQVASELSSPMAQALADALADHTSERAARRTHIEALVALGEPGTRQAEQMIDDDGPWFMVRNGASILGEVGGDRAIEHLTSALGHDDARVRREAVMALARIGGEDAGALVVGMVDDPDPDVRGAAAMALGVMKVERAVKPLLQRLEEEEEEDVQVQILRALGGLGDPGAVPAIEKRAVASFFSRPPTPLRIAAYKALSDIGTPHAMELLETAAVEKDDEVREAVQTILSAREG